MVKIKYLIKEKKIPKLSEIWVTVVKGKIYMIGRQVICANAKKKLGENEEGNLNAF